MAMKTDMNNYKILKIVCTLTNQVCGNPYSECNLCGVNMGREKMVIQVSRRGGF